MTNVKNRAIYSLLAILLIACSSGLSAEDIADRLTEALNINGASLQDGPPPEETPGDDHPEIASIEAPEELRFGQYFSISLSVDTADAEQATGLIIWVNGSSGYLKMEQAAISGASEGAIYISGTLGTDVELAEKDYQIYFALLAEDGLTGPRSEWSLNIPKNDCAIDEIDCSDSQMQNYLSAETRSSRCEYSDECMVDGDIEDSESPSESSVDYQCVYCCSANEAMTMDKDTFVNCGVCQSFMIEKTQYPEEFEVDQDRIDSETTMMEYRYDELESTNESCESEDNSSEDAASNTESAM